MTYNYGMITYICALIVLAALLAAHVCGLDGYYFIYPWYDIMMHILGGVGVGLFLAAIFKSYKSGVLFERRTIIIGVIFVGLVWEVFEMYYHLTAYPLWTKLYYLDTVKDLIDDTIGGAFIAYIVTRTSNNIKN